MGIFLSSSIPPMTGIEYAFTKMGFEDPTEVAKTFPILDLGERQGSSDYIDFLTQEDLSHPVMVGYDKFGRAFITMKVQEEVLTVFQRYPHDLKTWVSVGRIRGFNDESWTEVDLYLRSTSSV